MNDKGKDSVLQIFLIIVGVILLGTGLAILYNSKDEITNIIGGFVLIAISVAIGYKLLEHG